ncbi:MAG: DUF4384 domain-containing protein [Deltaproteobacteria bacterium]|nr:DUF4384 domain-containing protein [Deltaproteobacteria bacterium]
MRTSTVRYPFFVWLFFMLVISSPALASFSTTPDRLTRACEVLASRLAPLIPAGSRVAVRAFSSPDRHRTLLGLRVQDLLTGALASVEKRRYRVVERLRIAELDTERMLYGQGRGDDLDAWALKLRAGIIVLGTCSLSGDTLLLHARLVNPETGDSLAAAHTRVEAGRDIRLLASTPAPATATAVAMEAVSPGHGSSSSSRPSRVRLFRMSRGRPVASEPGRPITVKVGEKMGFSVRPPMDCRLYIFNYDPRAGDDQVVFVYPLPRIRPKVFLKDRTYTFPRCVDPRAVSYPVEPPLGRMVFKVIGVDSGTARRSLVSGLGNSRGYYVLDRNDLKGLISRLAVLPEAAWWEESVEFWIVGGIGN